MDAQVAKNLVPKPDSSCTGSLKGMDLQVNLCHQRHPHERLGNNYSSYYFMDIYLFNIL